jgi:DNA-binding beta-propeller fold protein YncE
VRTFAAFLVILLASAAALAAPETYKLIKTVPVPGDGGWDYLTCDEAGRRVYISHGTQVDVMDADTFELKGTIKDLNGVHGIAVAPDVGKGFISNGRSNSVTVFSLKDLKKIGDEIKTGNNPDAIIYDPSTKRVFAFNHSGKSATVIDAAEGKALETIELAGLPEFAVADGTGNVFANIEDKNTVVKIDAKTMKVKETWPLTPGEAPTGLSMDTKTKRLFVGCKKLLVVMNAENGKVVGKADIGAGVDATAFDPETKLIFSSCGDGTVTVVHEDGDDKYTVVETIKTKERSKTMALDLKTHNIFLASAEFKPAAGGGRPMIDPKTFAILVYSKGGKTEEKKDK